MHRSPHFRRPFVAVVGSLLILSAPLPITATPVRAVSADVVISEVYGGGGNTGATFTHDFIELYNRGTSAVDLTGWSVQYSVCCGIDLAGHGARGLDRARGHYLVQQAQGAGGQLPLPTPDATGSIAMASGPARWPS